MAQRDKQPALLIALVSTGLPWALGAALGRAGEGRPATGVTNAGLALGVAFTCLTWAVASTDIDDSRPLVGSLWFGQVVILITLITVREPLGAAMVGGLLVVPCLRMMGSEGGAQECTETLAASGPWWLASMFAAALAARF